MLHTRIGNIEARNLLGRAVAINPDFAAALGFLAVTHVTTTLMAGAKAPKVPLQTGLEIAERAIQVDDEEAQGRFALALLLWHREHDKALGEARRCLALEPNSAEGHIAIAIFRCLAVMPRSDR